MKILYNARIYTLDAQLPVVTALAIEQGRIVAIGDEARSLAEGNPACEKQDLAGRTIWPGLTDAHLHLEHYAFSLQKIDCETATRVECLHRVAERARQQPAGEWILGHGWNQNNWPEGYGSAADLDSVAPHHPVFLTAKSLHAAWVNSAALQRADIGPHTPAPPDGKIDRDAGGKPTGILFESAIQLVQQALPEPSPDQAAQAIRAAQSHLWQLGLTGVHDFDQRRCLVALQMLHQNDELHLRVLKGIPLEDLPHAVELGIRSGLGDDTLRIGPVKLFADGALGTRSAAMLEPYENDHPDNQGMLFLEAEQIFAYGQTAVSSGINLATHAIGDRANRQVLNAYAKIRQFERQNGLPPLRHRIEHAQLLHPDDLPRFARHAVIASVQPIHATSDRHMADRYWGKRAQTAYAFYDLWKAGTHLAFGSDAPVEPPNPFLGIHAAVTRCDPDGSPGPEGWHPQQRLNLLQALQAYTVGPAFAAGLEDQVGKLMPGYLADLIILEHDPFQLQPQEIYKLRPLATMIGGHWVWQT